MTLILHLKIRLSFFVIALMLGCAVSNHVSAQTCTQQNSPPVNKAGWLKGTPVKYYIDPSIIGLRRDKVIQAFDNWNAASGADGNNSRVTYELVNSPPPPGGNGFTITDGTAVPGDRATTTTTVDANGYTIGARTTLDSRVTDLAAVLEVMSHEIGHPAGFGDCLSCSPADSVMALGATDYNELLGRPTSPSNCDNLALAQTDYPPCNPPVNTSGCQVWDPNTCTCGQYMAGGEPVGGGGDGSGYGQTQGCTDYYWFYFTSYDGGETWQLDDVEYAGCY